MTTLQSIAIRFDRKARVARTIAFAAFDESYPNLGRAGTLFLKRQGSDIVVGIAYSTGMPQRPAPYKVYLVNPALGTAMEIDLSKQPQYLIKGRK
jgi:hypothetical protein